MNKKIIDQAMFFLPGICSRAKENKEYFEKITADFKAGTKNFMLEATYADDAFSYIFNGEAHCDSPDEFCDFLEAEMQNYDSMHFSYYERGKLITVDADEKRVTSKTTDRDSVEAPSKIGRYDIKTSQNKRPQNDDLYTFHTGTSTLLNREYYIKPTKAARLLTEIGIMGQNGKIKNDKIRKYNQIDHFVELLHPLLVSLCRQNRPINVIDCGCGKSYLSFVLNYYIKEVLGHKCNFTGLDYNEIVINDSKKTAENLGYANMEFICTDIKKYTLNKEYDLLLTLHACDVATDYALNFALRNNVKSIVCVPCCHREMNAGYSIPKFENVLKYGALKSKIAASLTDGMRALYLESQGYTVNVDEYVSPLDTPKNIMIHAEKTGDVNYDKVAEFYKLCELLGTHLTIGEDI